MTDEGASEAAEADEGFVYRDPDTAPPELLQLAKRGGKGWVYEVDVTHVVRDRPISMKSVVGMWEVDEEGELTGWFAVNAAYEKTGGAVKYVLQLFPHDIESQLVAADATARPLSYASPALRRWYERWPFSLVTDDDPSSRVIAIVGLVVLLGLLVWMKVML